MNFHEPDLEDLIQSDLHSEMNKILDQSETVDHEVNSNDRTKSPLNLPQLMATDKSLQFEKPSEEVKLLTNKPSINQCISDDHNSENLIESIKYMKEELGNANSSFVFETNTSKSEEYSNTLNLNQPTFSGHFSLEKLPSSQESINLEECHVGVPEANDLSSLTWLTGVDVQQNLQASSSVSNTITSNSFEEDLIQPQCIQDSPHAVPTNLQLECSTIKPAMNASPSPGQVSKKQSVRFTPIQPNVQYEECQRYQLHQGGDPMRSRMFSNERLGMHRTYHPYPPPPYGSAASYVPDSYRHNRLHNQGKKVFPKPVYSYSCLIAMSLRASKTGCLPVSDIYNFMMENFPYFKTAPDGWKNSVRHNLSLNKCFEKVEKPNGSQRKGCLWALNPAKIAKMEEEVQKWKRKDPEAIRRSMSNPEELDRELEEIRRADEEAARRRMLSMASHGLSMLTPPPPGFNPYSRPTHQPHQHPNLHPSGTASLPTTPQHYHHQQNPPRSQPPPAHGHAMSGAIEEPPHSNHPPRQLFNYSLDQQNFSYGSFPSSSSDDVALVQQSDISHPNLFTPPYSTSLSSSGNTSLLGTLADTISKSGGDLNEIDLDSSLADLSAFQGALWDESEGGLMAHPLVSEVESLDDVIAQRSHPSISSSSMEQCPADDKALPSASIFGSGGRFVGDIYMNGSSKAVALH